MQDRNPNLEMTFDQKWEQSPVDAALELLGGTRTDIPGLYNVPGHAELTSNQLLGLTIRTLMGEADNGC